MATIKEKGTLSWVSEVQTGTSATGNAWARQTLVVDVEGFNGSFRKVAVQAGTQQITAMRDHKIAIGDKVQITYQVTAREYQGKYYNNVDLFRIEKAGEQPVAAPQQMQQTAYAQPMQMPQQPMYQQMIIPSTPQVPPGANTTPMTGDLPF